MLYTLLIAAAIASYPATRRADGPLPSGETSLSVRFSSPVGRFFSLLWQLTKHKRTISSKDRVRWEEAERAEIKIAVLISPNQVTTKSRTLSVSRTPSLPSRLISSTERSTCGARCELGGEGSQCELAEEHFSTHALERKWTEQTRGLSRLTLFPAYENIQRNSENSCLRTGRRQSLERLFDVSVTQFDVQRASRLQFEGYIVHRSLLESAHEIDGAFITKTVT